MPPDRRATKPIHKLWAYACKPLRAPGLPAAAGDLAGHGEAKIDTSGSMPTPNAADTRIKSDRDNCGPHNEREIGRIWAMFRAIAHWGIFHV
jgi:hypothetical protein